MHTARFVLVTTLIVVVAFAVTSSAAPSTWTTDGRQLVGKVYSYNASSPRVLPASWTDKVVSPGATFVRLHFVDFQLGVGDKLTVASANGAQTWTYADRGPNGNGQFWSFAVDGDTAKITLHNNSGTARGYRIVQVGHGTVNLNQLSAVPEVLCGTDGREAIACRTGDPVIDASQRPVARLLFTSGGSQYLCTGELVAGSNSSTMITNNHCMSTQTEVSSLQATFNYQYTTCGGSTLAPTTNYAGGTFLKTNAERYNRKNPSGLDYTLLTLQGNPEATWGELIPSNRSVAVGQTINFIQHPGGNPKQIGYWEDAAHSIRCKIDTINQTYGSAKPNSQVGYGCDSEGGSSGSAITDSANGHIVALHHYGGVSSSPCLNSGTAMSLICADAGSLLSCVSN